MARILIVEDNPISMKLAVLLLEQAGHSVLKAIDAEAGLALASQDLPHLILMDLQLAGMSGLEATAILKRNPTTQAIPVIAFTAHADKREQDLIRSAGCEGYIAKPLQYKEFLATVARLLTGSE